MPGRIPDNILEAILNSVNIVELISGYLPLKRAGRNFKANCPFHHEKTPSFMVSADKQIFHCFGCGESGNAFKFLMKYERMEFVESVEYLAKKTGIQLPREEFQDKQAVNLITGLYKVLESACAFYQDNLGRNPAAKNYLLKRGLKEESIKAFKLGLAKESWDSLIVTSRQKGHTLSLLEKAGLAIAKDGGGYYDRFRSRLIFPIFDIKSRPLAFGARVLDNSLPKYLNSPETAIYTKGRHLYGLNFARDAIRELDLAIIVEGYLDFILPFQEGVKNLVASLGTALTVEQVRLIKRYTHNVVALFDPDSAGEQASLRSLDIFIEEEMSVKVATLPPGFDPDLFVRKFGAEKFRETIKNALNLFDYKIKVLKERHNIRSVEGKAKIAQEMLFSIHKFKNEILKSEYIKKLSLELDVNEGAILKEEKKLKGDAGSFGQAQRIKQSSVNPAEKLLIMLMLEQSEFIAHVRKNIEPADFQDSCASRIASLMFSLAGEGKDIHPKLLLEHLNDEEVSEFICESIFSSQEASSEQKEKMVNDCISRLKEDKLKSRRSHLHDQIKAAQASGDEDRINLLLEEFHCLVKKRS